MLLRKQILDKKKYFDLSGLNKKLQNKNASKNFFMYIMGVLVGAIAISVLYEKYSIVTSGSTGIAFLLTRIIGIDLSLMIFVVCSLLLVVGFVVFGIEYGAKNIIITILSPIFVKAATLLNSVINFDGVSMFLITILAGILSGVSTGLIRKSGYSPGGLCVLYDIVNKKFKISVGNASLICNTIIMLISLFTFGISSFIYGFIALYVSSVITDRVMLGISNNKAFYIVTNKPLEVRDYIVNNLNYTVTIFKARGGYSGKRKKMLLCIIHTIEYTRVKEVIKEIDKDVFFLITDSYYVSK